MSGGGEEDDVKLYVCEGGACRCEEDDGEWETSGTSGDNARRSPFFCTGGGAVCAERHKSPRLN